MEILVRNDRNRRTEPSPARIAAVVSGFVFANAFIFLTARSVAGPPLTAQGLVVSVVGGVLAGGDFDRLAW